MKKVLKAILTIILVVVLIGVLFLGFLTLTEYKPEAVENIAIRGENEGMTVPLDQKLTIMTWNVGYSALGKDSDFVMDGGGNAPVADAAKVNEYLSGIKATQDSEYADFYFFQEADTNSARSFGIDMRDTLTVGNDMHALNYSCPYVPFPWPPMGKVNSGLFTTTAFDVDSAERISLPCPFSWPLRTANLKRCLLVSYLPIEGSDKQLVLVNLHLEAYDSGEGKIAQTNQLMQFVENEYSKGNYVIAGGDWNQVFPGTLDKYPNNHPDLWAVGMLDESMLSNGWTFAFDQSSPTCRLLNQPYNPADKENTQYYVIDGFMLSPNVELNSAKTLMMDFANSDHNPVKMEFTLK